MPGFIPPHGGYRSLLSYQKAEIIYDGTVCFCERFLDKKDRTCDQMVQAARSGKQNIAEASQASGTSKEFEMKLTNVARASLEELLIDYEDFLRTRHFSIWSKDSKEALYVRRLSSGKVASAPSPAPSSASSSPSHPSQRSQSVSYEAFRPFLTSRPPDVVANILICLIHQACYLLDKQLKQLEQEFLKSGGLREAMTRARLESRSRQKPNPKRS